MNFYTKTTIFYFVENRVVEDSLLLWALLWAGPSGIEIFLLVVKCEKYYILTKTLRLMPLLVGILKLH